ncbi:MAG: hypothetical protein KBT47_05080, partial [Armatimonadetes bacterium]|nr:hypothetical protein [Candidatus Hippobium faecium]
MYKSLETMVTEAYDITKDYCESRKWDLWEADVRVYKKFLEENYPEKYKDLDFVQYRMPVPQKVCDFTESLSREENAVIRAGFVAERLNSVKLRDPECPIVGAPSFDAKDFESKECHWGDHPVHSIGGKRGDGGHIQPDWEKLLKLGLCGILNEIDECEKINSNKSYFYQTSRTAVKGVISYIKRCENLCREKGFPKEAQVCRNLQTQAPKTFHEAVQLMFFMHIAFWHGEDDYWLCYGRFDSLLIDFYNNDIKNGILTREEALSLITYYFISLATTVNPHNGMSLLIGGKDRKGNFVYNEVSRLVLESRQKYHIDNPAVSLAYYEGMDEDFVNNVCNSLDSGTIAFFNGDLIERGLKNLGVSEEDAHIWGTQTCEEIGLLGCSNIWSVSPIILAPVYLLELIESIKDNIYIGKIEEIKGLYKARLGFE